MFQCTADGSRSMGLMTRAARLWRAMLLPVAALGGDTACGRTPELPRPEAAAVYIQVEGVDRENRPSRWTGSGVCILPDGWIVTNRHVAPGDARTANTIRVVFDAGERGEYCDSAEVVLVHPDRDLALLKCRGDRAPAPLGIGETRNVSPTDPVTCTGFPLGSLVATDGTTPSVSVVPGTISALRRDKEHRLHWIDVAMPVAGGNSGGALTDQRGALIGIITHRYEGFARAIPVQFVQELLGEAALEVSLEPGELPADGGKMGVVVKPRGPAEKLMFGRLRVLCQPGVGSRLSAAEDGGVRGTLLVENAEQGDEPPAVYVCATDQSGRTFERLVAIPSSDGPKQRLRGVIHSVTIGPKKANGWRWDAGLPDIVCNLYLDGLLAKQSPVARDQLRFLEATEFDCRAGDQIRIVVYDQDLARHDLAGEIRFTAGPDLHVTQPSSGQIERCDITLRPIPPRREEKDEG